MWPGRDTQDLPGDVVGKASAILERATAVSPTTPPSLPATTTAATTGTPLDPTHMEQSAEKIRLQASELVESLLSLLGIAAVPGLAPSAPLRSLHTGANGDGDVPLFRAPGRARAGSRVTVVLTVTNDAVTEAALTFHSTALIGGSGYDISSSYVTFSPRVALLPPGGTAEIEATIALPAQTPSGTYSALVQGMPSVGVRAVIAVTVD